MIKTTAERAISEKPILVLRQAISSKRIQKAPHRKAQQYEKRMEKANEQIHRACVFIDLYDRYFFTSVSFGRSLLFRRFVDSSALDILSVFFCRSYHFCTLQSWILLWYASRFLRAFFEQKQPLKVNNISQQAFHSKCLSNISALPSTSALLSILLQFGQTSIFS